MNVRDLIISHESLSLKPYKDSRGVLTIGYGCNLDIGISKSEAAMLLDNRIEQVRMGLDSTIPWWRHMDDVRQAVFVDMAYNLGVAGFLGFHRFLALCQQGEYTGASVEMLKSEWAVQVGNRATQLSNLMQSGPTEV